MQNNMNDQQKLKRAKSAYQKGNLKTALPIFEELYDKLNSPDLILDYADTLYQLKLFTQSSKVAQNDPEIFAKMAPKLFMKIMLANGRTLDARLFISRLKPKQAEEFESLIEKKEGQLQEKNTASLREITRDFIHLGDFPFNEQQARFNLASFLPLKEYLQAAKFVLRDPYVNPLIKSSIAKDLTILKIPEKITIYWLDQEEHGFIPKTVETFSKLPAVQKISEYIKRNYQQNDPQAFLLYSETFKLQMLYLFPFVKETITDPQAWFKALTSNGEPANKEYRRSIKWQKLIEKYISDLGK